MRCWWGPAASRRTISVGFLGEHGLPYSTRRASHGSPLNMDHGAGHRCLALWPGDECWLPRLGDGSLGPARPWAWGHVRAVACQRRPEIRGHGLIGQQQHAPRAAHGRAGDYFGCASRGSAARACKGGRDQGQGRRGLQGAALMQGVRRELCRRPPGIEGCRESAFTFGLWHGWRPSKGHSTSRRSLSPDARICRSPPPR